MYPPVFLKYHTNEPTRVGTHRSVALVLHATLQHGRLLEDDGHVARTDVVEERMVE